MGHSPDAFISDEALHMILGSVSYTSFRYLSSVGGLDINPNWDKVVAQPYHAIRRGMTIASL
jgi:hypothetical protein